MGDPMVIAVVELERYMTYTGLFCVLVREFDHG